MATKIERAINGSITLPRGFGTTLKNKDLELTGHSVAGFDTETDAITGELYLLTYDDGINKPGYLHVTRPYTVIDWLTSHKYRETINFFYNLEFDFTAWLKMLGQQVSLAMYGNGRATLDDKLEITDDENNYTFKLSYLAKKAFHIKVKGQKKYSYYDNLQYFQTSLDKAAKKYLGLTKDEGFKGKYSSKALFEGRETIEQCIARFEEHYMLESEWTLTRRKQEVVEMKQFFGEFKSQQEYREKLLKYAIRDASLCRQLGVIIVQGINNFANTRNFNSSATISEYYFRSNDVHIPKLAGAIFKKFLETYYGGRFEITHKGHVEQVSMFDIKSAYPYAMTKMPILSKHPICKNTYRVSESSKFGAYLVNVDIPVNDYLSPLPIRNGVVKFPTGRFNNYWIDKVTLELLQDIGYKYHIIRGVEIYDENADYRLAELVHKLFAIKEDKKNPEVVRQAAKIILNSLYGKFIQLVDDTMLEAVEELEDLDNIGPNGLFNINNKLFAKIHTTDFKAGKMFAPYYGAFITAYTRRQNYEAGLKVGLEKVVGIHTDSLMLRGAYLQESSALGGFEMEVLKDIDEETGEVKRKIPMKDVPVDLFKCGFYQAEINGAMKIKARGVGKAKTLLQDRFEVTRRYGLKQAIKKDFNKMNIISPRSIENDINSDTKRTWDRLLTMDDIRNGRYINSRALVI